ncbi:hypothetical protein LUD75_17205 [Epilithonimonas sp. JDS]|uniref:hypothetical protein n=1 Tax=Epilithonimonas sp. JDS TaxID=2902797 RepID=UPI001E2B31BC|nr:hypothetical protein [Epilithonimonas sp. JDS]MCD9856464.1 hypothetical protein [Epilithonimonas sp. JDS]
MKTKQFFCCFSFFLLSVSCSDYIDNARIYAEGKITTENGQGVSTPLKITNSFLVSEGISKSDGTFGLGGPATVDSANLFVGRKVLSFSANVTGCRINYDSLSIKLPSGQGYTKFDNITVE